MNDRNKNIQDISPCYSEKELIDFSKGNLDKVKSEGISKHIEHCEMCSDVLEGIKLMPSGIAFSSHVDKLNSMIDDRVKQKKQKRFFSPLRTLAAAILVLAVVASVLVINKYSKDLTHNDISSVEQDLDLDYLDEPSSSNKDDIGLIVNNEEIRDAEPEEPNLQSKLVEVEDIFFESPEEETRTENTATSPSTGAAAILSDDYSIIVDELELADEETLADKDIEESGSNFGYFAPGSSESETKGSGDGLAENSREQTDKTSLSGGIGQVANNSVSITTAELDVSEDRKELKNDRSKSRNSASQASTAYKQEEVAKEAEAEIEEEEVIVELVEDDWDFDSEIDENIVSDIVMYDSEDGDEPEPISFAMVEEQPIFPGGETELLKFIADSTIYPDIAKEEGIEGKVYVQFTIDTTGKVVDPIIVRSIDPMLDSIALETVKKLPDWIPGKLMGKTVDVRYVIPIVFKLQ